MIQNNYAVVMAGGVGSRFWPYSRKTFPKQFHDVLGTGKSLLQQTVDRFKGICLDENIYVVTNEAYKPLVMEQLPFLKDEQILLEKVGKNTAPCIAYAAYKIQTQNPDANIVTAPSDHIILKEEEYRTRLQVALEASAKDNKIITLGITPNRPDTGYGYIRFEENESLVKHVLNFTEKPKLEIAKAFVSSGDYVWNAGIFIFKAATIIQAFEKFEPEITKPFSSISYYSKDEQEQVDKVFLACKEISIDYAVMERAENVYVVLSDIGWSDLGTWKSLYEMQDKDENANVLDGNIKAYETKNCIIKTPSKRLVVTQGLEGFIVAEYDNVLMICKKDDEQEVKKMVNELKSAKADDFI
jgi:mannose-1-phosphate guanylyltransferase